MDQLDFLLTRRVDKIYPSKEELEKVLRSGKKLRIYQGFDPSSPTLHIGHLAGLKKLADFQAQGHEVIFLIGDFTGMIGDPSGKLSERKKLTHEQVLKNAKEYTRQAGKVLIFNEDLAKKMNIKPVTIKFNYDWNSKLNFEEVLNLAACVTAQNMWERDMFQERVKKNQEVWLHELLYPLIQGYDSVAMDVDMEIGGTDQMFNMMIGRELLHKMKNKNKFVLTTPLLTDKEGRKIGKTEGNAIAIADPPNVLFKNIMTLPDDVIIPAFKLITDLEDEKIEEIEKKMKKGENPINFKKQLAHTIVRELNSTTDADKAQEEFEHSVQSGEVPEKIPEFDFSGIDLITALAKSMMPSKSEAKRLIGQNAIEINGKIVTNQKEIVKTGDVIKIGKKTYIKVK